MNAEAALIGVVLRRPDLLDEVSLRASDFADSRHAHIWRTIERLTSENRPLDLVLLVETLRARNELELAGGQQYVLSISEQGQPEHLAHYVELVRRRSLLRRLASLGSGLTAQALEETTDPDQLLEWLWQSLNGLEEQGDGPASLGETAFRVLDRIERICREGRLPGISSGFASLDEMTGGWQRGELIVLAARPSMGKTSLALTMAYHAALAGHRVVIFSLEMSSEDLALRILSMVSGVSLQAMRLGRIRDDQMRRLVLALKQLDALPIVIDSRPAIGAVEMRRTLRRLRREGELGLVVVDYLQLMSPDGAKNGATREQEVGAIARSLKMLALELEVPVVALSQLSRAVENRPDRRPMLSDLRESGSIEADADVVLFIYRPERYGITVDEDGNPTEGLAEIIIGKQRNGPTGTVRLYFDQASAAFRELNYSKAEGWSY